MLLFPRGSVIDELASARYRPARRRCAWHERCRAGAGNLVRTIANPAGSDAVQQLRIAEALHLQQGEVDGMTIVDDLDDICRINE